MLRITTSREDAHGVYLKLEGKIVAQWSALLEDVCEAYLRKGKAISLDCSSVDFIDAAGIAVIRSFPARIELTAAPEFLVEMLQSGGAP
jgi:anti-anti-sigma regulatory factor